MIKKNDLIRYLSPPQKIIDTFIYLKTNINTLTQNIRYQHSLTPTLPLCLK